MGGAVRWIGWVVGVLLLAAATGTLLAWLGSPSTPVVEHAAPTPRDPLDPSRDRSSDPGARCDLEEAPKVIARARSRSKLGGRIAVVPRAWLSRDLDGVRATAAYEDGEPSGLHLASVPPGSVPADLGLRERDVIGEAGGRQVRERADVVDAFERFVVDGVTCARVWRDGRWRVRWYVLEPES